MTLPLVLSGLTSVAGVIDTVTGFFTGKDDNASQAILAKLELAKIELQSVAKQAELQAVANIEQAKHASIFVAGARPAMMWVCVFGLAYEFFIRPMGMFIYILVTGQEVPVLPPSLNDVLWELTFSTLGLGTWRGVEKIKGVARNSLK